MNFARAWFAIWWGLHALSFALVCLHCLQRRREATSAILWIFVSWSFPIIGPVLYLTVGIDRLPHKGFHKRKQDARLLEARKAREEALPLAYWRAVHAEDVHGIPETGLDEELSDVMDAVAPEYPFLSGNAVLSHVTGDELFPRMLQAIDQASHHIHLQSFIIQNDATGRMFMEHLAARAKSGIKVRLLYDRFGSTRAIFSRLFSRYRHIPNLEIVGWTQVSPLKRRFQLNLRNHRKALIVDGRRAFVGGINLHQGNTTRANRAPIRDYHFEFAGPIVQEVQYAFMKDWHFMTNESPDILLQDVFFPSIAAEGNSLARVLCSGPTSELKTIADVLFMAIVRAQKQILIVTPYFAPPYDILRALRSAAIRGVDVRIILPQKNNHIYAGWASRALYEELLLSGVRLFERPEPFLHAKAMIIDDRVSIVGTANWDVRSLRLNYETNVAIHDEVFANALKRIVLDDEAQSSEIELAAWRQRPQWHRLAENACSLMTPIL
ncbi:MAG: cardiolipin synthase [Verrucomicrobia bacterium]|jgi:cardiolipin synthase A/B|nr:cardiolipin synthase [Verrucomicrobiota bacterium]